MKILSFLSLALILITTACAKPQQSCEYHFAGGKQPVITSQNLAKQTTMLCFEDYAVLHSGVSRTPVWSAEHLTATRIKTARGMKRQNAFHAEEKLPPSERAELKDYARSGFDRGHMSPSGDMPTPNAQYESFSLANMIPQHPKNNQILWEGIEAATRSLTQRDGELYVVTGPIFEGSALQRLNGRILVPTSVFKAIYDPARNAGAAYLTPNAPGMAYQTLSIAELEQRIHINLFPSMPAALKAVKMQLPVPTPHGFRKSRSSLNEINP